VFLALVLLCLVASCALQLQLGDANSEIVFGSSTDGVSLYRNAQALVVNSSLHIGGELQVGSMDVVNQVQSLNRSVSSISTNIATLQSSFVAGTGLVLMVGANHPYPTIVEAWAAIQNQVFSSPVTIQVDCSVPTTIPHGNIDFGPHPSSPLITIKGNLAAPQSCRLVQQTPAYGLFRFLPGSNGISLGGFTLVGLDASQWGIVVSMGSFVYVATLDEDSGSLRFENFAYGAVLADGGQFMAGYGVHISNCFIGLSAQRNGLIVAPFSNITNVSYIGIQAYQFGTVIASQTTMSTVTQCVGALVGSKVLLDESTLSCGAVALQATQVSLVSITNSLVNSTTTGTGTAFDSLSGSTIDFSYTRTGGFVSLCYCAGSGARVMDYSTAQPCCAA